MNIDLLLPDDPLSVGAGVDSAVAAGMAGGWVTEAKHDPFLLISTAAARSRELTLGTAVAVAFARTPMLLATLGNDLQLATRGNFVMGLGTQIKPHIERRYGMPWSAPAKRMGELVAATQEIWDCWDTGRPLNFVGEYYQHTLMTPAFSPGPNPFGPPPIYLGALGPAMTELAGRVADGLIVHRFVSHEFIRDVLVPQVQVGLNRRERPLREPFQIVYPPQIIVSNDDAERADGFDAARKQISFFASSPGFLPVLAHHGWQELGTELQTLSRSGRWAEMPGRIDDSVVEALAVVCEPTRLQDELNRRFADTVTRIVLSNPLERREHPGEPAA